MKKALYKEYENIEAIGYYCMGNYGGLEVLDIEYGIDDKLITCFNFGTGRQMIRRNKVLTTSNGRLYIRKAGYRFYLDNIMRAGV